MQMAPLIIFFKGERIRAQKVSLTARPLEHSGQNSELDGNKSPSFATNLL